MTNRSLRRHSALVAIAAVLPGLVLAQLAPNEQSAHVMRLDRFVVPDFPAFLRQSGVLQGTVVVAVGHETGNRATDVLVLESTDPRFTDAALDAIREWKFAAPNVPSDQSEATVPIVRFLFTTGSVSVVPLTASTGRSSSSRAVRAETPIELPNFSHLDHVPKPLQNPPPEFPIALRGRVTNGTVVVKYFVDAEGRVRLPTIITATEPEFAAAALTAIRQWRFEPPRIDGKSVVALERLSFQFAGNSP